MPFGGWACSYQTNIPNYSKMAIKVIYIDLFCGAGGTSTGVHLARHGGDPCAKVIACVNHDANAIASHAANHPDAMHYTEDIRTLELGPLAAHVARQRRQYPDAFVVLWASLECTNFSRAKGGLPIVFPKPTHTKNPAQGDLFGQQLRKWRPVREVLDLEDEGESIFDRKRSLVEASLARIHAGLVKFVAGGREAFLVKYNSMNQSGKYVAPGIDEPCPTVATQNRLGVAKVYYLCKHFGGSPEGKCTAVDAPAGAITCRDHHAFVSAYYGNGFNSSIERPSPTVTTKDRFQLVRPFFANYYSGGGQTSGTDGPAPAVMTNPKQRLVTPWIMNTNFSNVGSSLDAPAQTVPANRKWQYLMNPQFASAGAATDRPCFTLIARMDKRPSRLVTAVADGEALPSFIRLEDETLVYEIYPEDTPMLVQIKEFMALYGLVDIRMRMLRIPELMRIMGFPENYVLIGTQGEQKKFIGNAVEVNMARVLCEALVAKLYELNIVPQRFAA